MIEVVDRELNEEEMDDVDTASELYEVLEVIARRQTPYIAAIALNELLVEAGKACDYSLEEMIDDLKRSYNSEMVKAKGDA